MQKCVQGHFALTVMLQAFLLPLSCSHHAVLIAVHVLFSSKAADTHTHINTHMHANSHTEKDKPYRADESAACIIPWSLSVSISVCRSACLALWLSLYFPLFLVCSATTIAAHNKHCALEDNMNRIDKTLHEHTVH